MADKIELIVNSEVYDDVIEARVTKDIDYIAGSYSFLLANRFLNNQPLRINDRVIIRVGGEDVINGYLETLNNNITSHENNVSITGHDITANLAITEIYSNADYSFTDLKSLIESVMSDNGVSLIGVIDQIEGSEDFNEGERQVGDTGQNIFEFINIYAEKANRVLTSDGAGNVLIHSNTGIDLGVELINSDENSVFIDVDYDINFNNRFKKVIVKSQAEDLTDGGEDISGEATDLEVVRDITKVIISDTTVSKDTAQKMAEFEVNKRRSDSISYTCTVANFHSDSGALWQPNLLVSIKDSITGIKAVMILKSVVYKYDMTNGATADLVFVSEDTYSLRTQASKFNEGVQ